MFLWPQGRHDECNSEEMVAYRPGRYSFKGIKILNLILCFQILKGSGPLLKTRYFGGPLISDVRFWSLINKLNNKNGL